MVIPKDGTDYEQPSVEYAMMAAVKVIGIDPVSISNAKKCKDWPEWDLAIQCKLAQHNR